MVYMFLADGFETVEALGTLDILRRAGVEVKTVSIGSSKVTSRQGVSVTADTTEYLISAANHPDMIILPGGIPGADNLFASKKVEMMLLDAAERSAYIAAICAAPYILGRLGLLKGKRAVCYPGDYEAMLEGATLVDAPVVVDGNIITARAMGASLEFGLTLAEILTDRETADLVAASIYYDRK